MRLGLLVLPLVAGCSLVTSLDGLRSNGANADAGGNDASVPDGVSGDGAADADAGPSVVGTLSFAANWGFNFNAYAIAAIPAGGWVFGGGYQHTLVSVLPFGSYNVPKAVGLTDAFVGTVDSNGNPTGFATFGAANYEHIQAVGVDSTGAVYIAGVASAGVTLGTTNVPAGAFVAKLDGKKLSTVTWVASLASPSVGFCPGCLRVVGNTVTVLGTMGDQDTLNTSMTYAPTKTLASAGYGDMFVARYDAVTGALTWIAQGGGAGDDAAGGLDVDANGSVVVTGKFKGPLTAGRMFGTPPPAPVAASAPNLVVARLTPTGGAAWAKAYGDSGGTFTTGEGIASDGKGRVAVAANFAGGVDFGKGVVGSTGADGIVFVYDETKSATAWQQTVSGTATEGMTGCAFDPWGHLVITGYYGVGGKVGTDALPSGTGMFVAKFGPAYAPEWMHGYVGVGPDGGAASLQNALIYDLAIAPSGGVAVAGGMSGSTKFDVVLNRSSYMANQSDTLLAGWLP